MANPERFAFTSVGGAQGVSGYIPELPITLVNQQQRMHVRGLLDTGATVNVLPYDVGRQLGARWEQQTTAVQLTGNLAQQAARVLIVSAVVGPFAPIRLAFAWTRANNIPLILGQVNFFLEFNVCFYRSQLFFDVEPKA